MLRHLIACLLVGALAGTAEAQALGARRLGPNVESSIDTPLRYRPEGGDFVIENGGEYFNRPLYGGNTAFRVDAGDKPEFTMYLPGRGGNLRLGVKGAGGGAGGAGGGAKWLLAAESITARYRPGGMVYDIKDPILGAGGVVHLEVYALAVTEGLVLKVEGRGTPAVLELVWAYGGVNGQRGTRDGDIGTERVPISEYFQLSPEFCRGNVFEPGAGSFTLRSTPGVIFGRVPGEGRPEVGDARQWASAEALLAPVKPAAADLPVMVGKVMLVAGEPRYLSLQRLAAGAVTPAEELPTYQAVTASRPSETAPATRLLPAFRGEDLPKVFADAETHFKAVRERVVVETPDPYLNAAVGALNVAADAVWDEPQGAVMHGAIAWRSRLLGWRGPYSMDDLGWHDRAQRNFEYWATRQNVSPIPARLPGPDESQNLSRSEAALHGNGDMSNSHYDMNMVHIDAVFRHILWTGDMEFARREWPVIERHLAWEQRMFRRPFGPEKLPLYEAYAAIWASDDLEYGGGGVTHSSAYNYFHNRMAAKLARLLGKDPAPYDREAELIARAMREYLWLGDRGWYAEYRDYLGLQMAHPSAALWSFYHTVDSEVMTPLEAWQMTRYLDTQMPHIPVRGAGVPADESWQMMASTDWMPYRWSINNVTMGENAHTALGYWQAGRRDEAHRLLASALLASMYMGIAPGNVGTMNYLDVYRRESQRDFGDGSGALSRAVVEGLFGLRPDVPAGELRVMPGFPEKWDHASIRHPDASVAWRRTGDTDRFTVESRLAKPVALRLEWPAHLDEVAGITVNGQAAQWRQVDDAVGTPRIVINAPAAARWEIVVNWRGKALTGSPKAQKVEEGQTVSIGIAGVQADAPVLSDPQHLFGQIVTRDGQGVSISGKVIGVPGDRTLFVRVRQGVFAWWLPVDIQVTSRAVPAALAMDWAKPAQPAEKFEMVDLSRFFNERVTQIFKKEYRSPRSPFVSLAIPKQGIGAWAGEVNATADIDDRGLRAAAAANGGKILLPNGAPLATPGTGDAPNIVFTSRWDNFPHEVTVPITGKAQRVILLMAGSTNSMQSRFENGEVIVKYTDGSSSRLALVNPTNWWPIEQDYFIDDYQFRRPGAIPPRLSLRTGEVRLLIPESFKGKGGTVAGGAATLLDLPLAADKELQSLTVRTLANEVVIGLMSATLVR